MLYIQYTCDISALFILTLQRKTKRIMEINTVIKLKKDEKFDLSEVKPQQRVVYLKDKNSIVVVYSQRVAPQVRMIYGDDALFMSAPQLADMYPEQFTNTPRKKIIRGDFSEQLYIYLTKKQKDFVSSKDNTSAYIRSLIDKAMEAENVADGD